MEVSEPTRMEISMLKFILRILEKIDQGMLFICVLGGLKMGNMILTFKEIKIKYINFNIKDK